MTIRFPGTRGPLIALILSALVAAASLGAVAVAGMTFRQADRALTSAQRLRETRLDLANAQKALGDTDLGQAVEGAEAANEIAERLQRSTARMLPLLASAEREGRAVSATTERTARQLKSIVGRTALASRILRVLAREQTGSSRSAAHTNDFLRRILAALRETNRSFPTI